MSPIKSGQLASYDDPGSCRNSAAVQARKQSCPSALQLLSWLLLLLLPLPLLLLLLLLAAPVATACFSVTTWLNTQSFLRSELHFLSGCTAVPSVYLWIIRNLLRAVGTVSGSHANIRTLKCYTNTQCWCHVSRVLWKC